MRNTRHSSSTRGSPPCTPAQPIADVTSASGMSKKLLRELHIDANPSLGGGGSSSRKRKWRNTQEQDGDQGQEQSQQQEQEQDTPAEAQSIGNMIPPTPPSSHDATPPRRHAPAQSNTDSPGAQALGRAKADGKKTVTSEPAADKGAVQVAPPTLAKRKSMDITQYFSKNPRPAPTTPAGQAAKKRKIGSAKVEDMGAADGPSKAIEAVKAGEDKATDSLPSRWESEQVAMAQAKGSQVEEPVRDSRIGEDSKDGRAIAQTKAESASQAAPGGQADQAGQAREAGGVSAVGVPAITDSAIIDSDEEMVDSISPTVPVKHDTTASNASRVTNDAYSLKDTDAANPINATNATSADTGNNHSPTNSARDAPDTITASNAATLARESPTVASPPAPSSHVDVAQREVKPPSAKIRARVEQADSLDTTALHQIKPTSPHLRSSTRKKTPSHQSTSVTIADTHMDDSPTKSTKSTRSTRANKLTMGPSHAVETTTQSSPSSKKFRNYVPIEDGCLSSNITPAFTAINASRSAFAAVGSAHANHVTSIQSPIEPPEPHIRPNVPLKIKIRPGSASAKGSKVTAKVKPTSTTPTGTSPSSSSNRLAKVAPAPDSVATLSDNKDKVTPSSLTPSNPSSTSDKAAPMSVRISSMEKAAHSLRRAPNPYTQVPSEVVPSKSDAGLTDDLATSPSSFDMTPLESRITSISKADKKAAKSSRPTLTPAPQDQPDNVGRTTPLTAKIAPTQDRPSSVVSAERHAQSAMLSTPSPQVQPGLVPPYLSASHPTPPGSVSGATLVKNWKRYHSVTQEDAKAYVARNNLAAIARKPATRRLSVIVPSDNEGDDQGVLEDGQAGKVKEDEQSVDFDDVAGKASPTNSRSRASMARSWFASTATSEDIDMEDEDTPAPPTGTRSRPSLARTSTASTAGDDATIIDDSEDNLDENSPGPGVAKTSGKRKKRQRGVIDPRTMVKNWKRYGFVTQEQAKERANEMVLDQAKPAAAAARRAPAVIAPAPAIAPAITPDSASTKGPITSRGPVAATVKPHTATKHPPAPAAKPVTSTNEAIVSAKPRKSFITPVMVDPTDDNSSLASESELDVLSSEDEEEATSQVAPKKQKQKSRSAKKPRRRGYVSAATMVKNWKRYGFNRQELSRKVASTVGVGDDIAVVDIERIRDLLHDGVDIQDIAPAKTRRASAVSVSSAMSGTTPSTSGSPAVEPRRVSTSGTILRIPKRTSLTAEETKERQARAEKLERERKRLAIDAEPALISAYNEGSSTRKRTSLASTRLEGARKAKRVRMSLPTPSTPFDARNERTADGELFFLPATVTSPDAVLTEADDEDPYRYVKANPVVVNNFVDRCVKMLESFGSSEVTDEPESVEDASAPVTDLSLDTNKDIDETEAG